MKAINLAEKLALFSEHFQPGTVGEFNGHDLMVVKVKGPFVWHKHDETDDFFLVLKGSITIQMREGAATHRGESRHYTFESANDALRRFM